MSPPSFAYNSEDRVFEQLARALDLVYVDLKTLYISAATRGRIPARLARRVRLVPLIANSRRVVLVSDDPLVAVTRELGETGLLVGPPWGRPTEFALTSPSAMDRFLQEHYAPVAPR